MQQILALDSVFCGNSCTVAQQNAPDMKDNTIINKSISIVLDFKLRYHIM